MRDFHMIPDSGIAFFPESGKLYSVPPAVGAALAAWRDGAGPLPAEAGPMLEKEAAREGAAPPPAADAGEVGSLCLYAAHDCNLACSYCYNQGGKATAPQAMMSFATAKAAIDRFFTRPGVPYALALYGGEPLLNARLLRPLTGYVDSLRRERDIRISLSLTTNGTVMSPEILELLDRHFSAVTVSLDGAAPVNDRHRRYAVARRHGSHDKAVETLRLLKSRTRLRVTVKGTLTAQGLPHYRQSLAYLRGLGADGAALDPAFGPDDADWALDDEQFDRYVEMQAAAAAADLADAAGIAGEWQEQTFQIVAGLLTRRRLLRHCNIGRDLAVMADGAIYACHGLAGVPAFHMGHVEEPKHPDFHRLRREFAGIEVRTVEDCNACWARYLCGGSCYANAWFRTGTVRRPDSRHCRLVTAVAERVVPAFAAAMARPELARAILQKMRGAIAAAPKPHA